MSDFETLRSRVEQAAEDLAAAEADRHRHADSLSSLLTRLEEKFEAQREELAFYKQRVRPLEEINDQLAGLMDRLLTMIDKGFGEASVAPIREAAGAAARILDAVDGEPAAGSESGPVETGLQAEPPAETAFAPEPEHVSELEPEPVSDLEAEPGLPYRLAEPQAGEGAFEDVGIDALLAEAEAEAFFDCDEPMPGMVAEAHLAAVSEDDPLAEVLEAIASVDAEAASENSFPAEGGEDENVIETMETLARRIAAESRDAEEGGEKADIRSLLTRVETAVEEVRRNAVSIVAPPEDEVLPKTAVA